MKIVLLTISPLNCLCHRDVAPSRCIGRIVSVPTTGGESMRKKLNEGSTPLNNNASNLTRLDLLLQQDKAMVYCQSVCIMRGPDLGNYCEKERGVNTWAYEDCAITTRTGKKIDAHVCTSLDVT